MSVFKWYKRCITTVQVDCINTRSAWCLSFNEKSNLKKNKNGMSGRRQRNFLITIYRLESISSVQIKKVYCLRYEDIVTGKNTILQNFLQQNNENIAFTQKDVLAVRDRLDVSDPFFQNCIYNQLSPKKLGVTPKYFLSLRFVTLSVYSQK